MTLGELKDALFRHLDVDDDEEKTKYFPVAVNHALSKVLTVFPMQGKYVIEPLPITNLVAKSQTQEYTIVSGNVVEYSASAKAYYFEVSGNGICDVIDDNGLQRIEFSTNEYTPFRGFVQGNVTLKFHSAYVFFVRNVALYDALISDVVEEIPAYTTTQVYDFRELTKEENEDGTFFQRFDAFMPEKFEERKLENKTTIPLENYDVEPNKEGHLLRIFGDMDTQKIIYYRKNFKPITDTTPDEYELEIPQALAQTLLDEVVYRINIDEIDISVERAQYEAGLLLNWKQQQASGQNTEETFIDRKGYLNYD